MILVVGSLNMDLVLRVQSLPRPGETVLGQDYETHPGGKGANQALAIARLGGKVRMLGRVGVDPFGQALKAGLAREGVDVTWVLETPGPSGTAFILVDPEGQNQIAVALGANGKLQPEDLTKEAFEGIKLLVVQMEIPSETIAQAIALAHDKHAFVLLNAAPAPSAQTLPLEVLRQVNLLVVNELEASQLAKAPVPRTPTEALAIARQLKMLIPHVVLTLGAQGVLLCSDTEGHLPAHRVSVLDSTAAGDAFVGALATALTEGKTLLEAVKFANAAGALATTRLGAQPSLPYRNEVDTLLERLEAEYGDLSWRILPN